MVSIIIPCFNSERFLGQTLESVLAQKFSDWECIIVDDGSTDSTFEISSAYTARDPRFQVHRQENKGRASALNSGFHKADPRVEYLFFLDSDDLLEKRALEVKIQHLEAQHDVCIVACRSQLIDAEGRFMSGEARSRWAPGGLLPRRLGVGEWETPFASFFCATGQGPFALHRRSVFEETGGFDPIFSEYSLHEDTDIFCRMALLGKVHYLSETLYRTRRHDRNVSNGVNTRVLQAYSKFREKWDVYEAKTAEQRRVIDAARRFYYGVFRPCRHLKVSAKALREGVVSWRRGSLKWALDLFTAAIRDLMVYRVLRHNCPGIKNHNNWEPHD